MSAPKAEFSYRIVSVGWAEATLAIGDQSVRLPASYLSDALGDLLAGLVLLIEGEESVCVSWEEEPGEYRFLFRPDGERVHLRLLAFDDMWPERKPEEAGQSVLDATCSLVALLAAVATGARAVLDEMGADGYRAKWVEHDFPLAELDAIERAVRVRTGG